MRLEADSPADRNKAGSRKACWCSICSCKGGSQDEGQLKASPSSVCVQKQPARLDLSRPRIRLDLPWSKRSHPAAHELSKILSQKALYSLIVSTARSDPANTVHSVLLEKNFKVGPDLKVCTLTAKTVAKSTHRCTLQFFWREKPPATVQAILQASEVHFCCATCKQSDRMNFDAEVIIIGSGVAGAASAYHLAEAGCKNVIVLESGKAGIGEDGGHGGESEPRLSGSAVMASPANTIKMVIQLYACSSEEYVQHHGMQGARDYLRSVLLLAPLCSSLHPCHTLQPGVPGRCEISHAH